MIEKHNLIAGWYEGEGRYPVAVWDTKEQVFITLGWKFGAWVPMTMQHEEDAPGRGFKPLKLITQL